MTLYATSYATPYATPYATSYAPTSSSASTVYATTTPYASAILAKPLYDFFSTLFCAVVVSAPFWYGLRQKLMHYYKKLRGGEGEGQEGSSDDSSLSSSDVESDKGEDYSMNYRTEYELLEDRALSSDDLDQLHNKMVKETTDFGDIIMTYHGPTESFWYYTNHLKEVSYVLLEAVARKFMVEHNCRRLGGQAPLQPPIESNTTPINSATSPSDGGALASLQGGALGGGAPPPHPHPYAKFKKYNTSKTSTNSKAGILPLSTVEGVVVQTNHFRYKGKLLEYEATRAQESNTTLIPSMTYAEFKQLMAEKKEN